jgi:uncharacterized protein YdiU (UPF0061 family)
MFGKARTNRVYLCKCNLIAEFGVENICVHDDASSRICFKQQQVVVLENMRRHKPATTLAQNPQHLRAQRQERATSKTHNKNYKRVMVKLVRLFSARPAAVSLVAIGLSLPNPL